MTKNTELENEDRLHLQEKLIENLIWYATKLKKTDKEDLESFELGFTLGWHAGMYYFQHKGEQE